MTDSRLPNLTSNFRDFFGFKNLSPRRSRESGVGGFFRGKESGVGKARESESGVGVGTQSTDSKALPKNVQKVPTFDISHKIPNYD